MNSRIRSAMTLTLALAVLPASALAQAAAEAALLKAGSSAATVKAGSKLNSVLDKGNKQIGARVQRHMSQPAPRKASQRTAPPLPVSPAKDAAAGESTAPGQGLVIASIQGGSVTRCAPTDRKAATPEGDPATASAPASCNGPEPAGKPAPQKYQSVITLSFTK